MQDLRHTGITLPPAQGTGGGGARAPARSQAPSRWPRPAQRPRPSCRRASCCPLRRNGSRLGARTWRTSRASCRAAMHSPSGWSPRSVSAPPCSGGDSRVNEALFRGLRERPWLRGRILALIGRGTFSSGMWAAIDLQAEHGALLLGEPTGRPLRGARSGPGGGPASSAGARGRARGRERSARGRRV